jgi:hypothetical protein
LLVGQLVRIDARQAEMVQIGVFAIGQDMGELPGALGEFGLAPVVYLAGLMAYCMRLSEAFGRWRLKGGKPFLRWMNQAVASIKKIACPVNAKDRLATITDRG